MVLRRKTITFLSRSKLVVENAFSSDLTGADGKPVEFHFEQDEGYEADDPENIIFVLSFDVRSEREDTASYFDVTVCTPNHLATRKSGEKTLALKYYTYSGLKREFLKRVVNCDDDSTYEAMRKLRQQFAWEYEGAFSEVYLKLVT